MRNAEFRLKANYQARLALSLDESAHAVGVSRSTIKRLIAEGRLAATHVGRRVLIGVEALDDLIERGAE